MGTQIIGTQDRWYLRGPDDKVYAYLDPERRKWAEGGRPVGEFKVDPETGFEHLHLYSMPLSAWILKELGITEGETYYIGGMPYKGYDFKRVDTETGETLEQLWDREYKEAKAGQEERYKRQRQENEILREAVRRQLGAGGAYQDADTAAMFDAAAMSDIGRARGRGLTASPSLVAGMNLSNVQAKNRALGRQRAERAGVRASAEMGISNQLIEILANRRDIMSDPTVYAEYIRQLNAARNA